MIQFHPGTTYESFVVGLVPALGKLARRPHPKFLIQPAFYSRLLARPQSVETNMTWVVTGDAARSDHPFRLADLRYDVDRQLSRYLAHAGPELAATYPDPCDACDLYRWRERCEAKRFADDHLCQVANISRQQTRRLEAAGVATLAGLAALPPGTSIPRIGAATFERLRHQARLQVATRRDGERRVEVLPPDDEGRLGFHRLPEPDPYDLYFDI